MRSLSDSKGDPGLKKKTIIPSTVIALGVTSFLTDVSSEMIYPLIPLFVSTLGSGALILGVIEGVAETTASMLKLLSGTWSDRSGKRKPLVLAGYILSSLMRPLIGAVSAAWQIVIIRMMDRVGKGIRTAPRDALIAQATPAGMRGKAYGFHRAMDHAGAMTGPIFALAVIMTLVLAAGRRDTLQILRWTFALALVPGILAALTIVFFVKEGQAEKTPGSSRRFSPKSADPGFMRFLAVLVLFTLGNSSDAFLLFRAREAIHQSGILFDWVRKTPLLGETVCAFGSPEKQKQVVDILFLPLIWSFFHLVKSSFSTSLGSLSDRVGRKPVITAGWGIYAAVYICFAFLDAFPRNLQVPATFVLFAVYALFYAFSEGAEKALVSEMVVPERRGAAFGLYHFSIGLAALPASILFGLLYSRFGARIAFGTGAGLALIAMILLGIWIREPERERMG
jgi:MFS family permease